MDTIRQQLKLCSRQYDLNIKTVVALQNNLISLTVKTFPGVNELLSSPERADGHQKWVGFCHDLLALRLHLPHKRERVYRIKMTS